MEFLQFKDECLTDAAKLLATRHKRERKQFPELPSQFELEDDALKAVEAVWVKENSEGIAIFDNKQMIGYLIGTFISNDIRGRHIWIDYAGLAISENVHEELYRDLYTKIAEQWVQYGCFDHYVLVPAGNRSILDAWLKLGFSFEQVHALCDITNQAMEIENQHPIEIRLAIKSDQSILTDIGDLIMSHQTGAPVWAAVLPEYLTEIKKGYGGIVEDSNAKLWIAFKGNQLIGFQGYWETTTSNSDMMTPDRCIELSIAGTKKEERGRGIGKLLTQKGFMEAKENGYQYCMSDWRMTNLQSSRFWPKRGFYPIAYRLTRKIDHRIMWANGKI
ncbi:GNAT family N-acetyltransferase [Chengkuizengella sediminis]|uniref:GNAT family N-acetyltransferase n=1 Tax=Chengkuizengella sediminis TaxID=1885917 RepID=UPI001389CE84|nr:GNAT family N-acetyltransferase [Chengkuizengella sediminis]NDI35433.1 GNAT family N-acetyltransferase [Chengkuizengella sediminis]